MNLHRLALLAVLGISALALAYNALSILHGDAGLAGLSPGLFQ